MKIVFVSNFFNHHQNPLCDAFYNTKDIEFYFISTEPLDEERIQMGYDKIEIPPYVVRSELSAELKKRAKNLIDSAHVVISGAVPFELLKNRLKKNKLIVYYTERVIRGNPSLKKKLKTYIYWKIRAPKRKNVFLLAASSYALKDYNTFGLFKGKIYKWGYFPKTLKYDVKELNKEENSILWCGRLLELKKPEDALNAALNLKNQGYTFKLRFIGNGEEEERIKSFVKENHLCDFVEFFNFMPTENARKMMEKSSIFLFTSDHREGWGAVLNESMNSGCAVITSHGAGASRFLVNDGINGLIYQSGNVEMLTEKLKYLLDNKEKQQELGKNAYNTISEKWNAETAAKRFIIFAKTIINGNPSPDLFSYGPCSIAHFISDTW